MTEGDSSPSRILRQAPTIGGRLMFTYIVGVATSLLLISPFKSITWVYDPVISYIILSVDFLPTALIGYMIVCIGVGFFEALEWTGKAVKRYIKEIAHEEETEK